MSKIAKISIILTILILVLLFLSNTINAREWIRSRKHRNYKNRRL